MFRQWRQLSQCCCTPCMHFPLPALLPEGKFSLVMQTKISRRISSLWASHPHSVQIERLWICDVQLNLEGEEEEEGIDILYFNKLQPEACRQPLQLGASCWGWHLPWLQGVPGVLSPPGWCSRLPAGLYRFLLTYWGGVLHRQGGLVSWDFLGGWRKELKLSKDQTELSP